MINAVKGNYPCHYETFNIYLHGFMTDSAILDLKNSSLNQESFAFLDKLSEFDPLADVSYPHLSISNLKYLDIAVQSGEMEICGLV
ncbi:hypothetical protein [Algoriphagus resistens]|uniref:hypothetical protein n=1 Tax=Algoriphagus resistens TaxID=1750590 RepID=UPI000716A46C|nr:hypothetical protein [Algoriphagus resistens]